MAARAFRQGAKANRSSFFFLLLPAARGVIDSLALAFAFGISGVGDRGE